MKYLTAITTLIILNILTVVMVVSLGKISRKNEKINNDIKQEISILKDQIKINELEYNIHNNYFYLKKLQKIYLSKNNQDNLESQIISLTDFNNKDAINFYKVKSVN